MKYFMIKEDKQYVKRPQIVNWYEKIDSRNINQDNAHKLPKRTLLFIKEDPNTVFTDIISSPFFLVSEMVKKVILMYEPRTILKEVVLLDKAYEKAQVYFLPIFEEVQCLSENSKLNLDHSEIQHGILDLDRIKEQSIFRIQDVRKTYIIGNLDIVESILKRGAVGVGLLEMETC